MSRENSADSLDAILAQVGTNFTLFVWPTFAHDLNDELL